MCFIFIVQCWRHMSNQTPCNIQWRRSIHTLQISKSTASSCTQNNHKVQKLVQGGHRVHSLALKIDSYSYMRKKNRVSQFFIILFHLHVHNTQSPLPPTLLRKQRSLCEGLGKPIFFIPCLPLSLAQLLATHASDHNLIASPS